nr:MAG TPA: hypothetical protein [Bacteriophage sp.]
MRNKWSWHSFRTLCFCWTYVILIEFNSVKKRR